MRSQVRLFALVATLLLAAVSGVVAQDRPDGDGRATEADAGKVSLMLKWQKGDVQRYKSTQITDTVQRMPGSPTTKSQSTLTQIIASNCIDVDDEGVATVEMKYELINQRQKSGITTTQWRSDRPDKGSQDLAKVLGPLSRATYTLKYDAKGQIIDVKGFDEVLEEIVEGYDEDMRDLLRGMLQNSMSNEAMLKAMNDGNAALPAIPVGPGDTWQSATRVNMGAMDMVGEFECVLEEIEVGEAGTIAKISGKGKFAIQEATEDEEGNSLFGGFDVTIEDDELGVETTFDVDRGLALKSVVTQSFKMIMTAKDGDLTIDQTVKSSTTMELLPAAAEEDDTDPAEAD